MRAVNFIKIRVFTTFKNESYLSLLSYLRLFEPLNAFDKTVY